MLKRYDDMKKIDKGWSNDEKYLVNIESLTFLLRVSPVGKHERIKKMIDYMHKVDELSIPICKPIDFNIHDDKIHALYMYIDGHDMIDVLDTYAKEDQYLLGIKSGQYLQKIHTIDVSENKETWAIKFNKKIDDKIKRYKESQLQVSKIELFVDYVESHRHLLSNRPECFQHGDYHVGNFMMDRDQNLVIIDFEKFDYGDPWEEFNRIVWSAQKSHAFASGMIDGYFDQQVPNAFWELLLLYIASNTISSLPWGLAISQEEYNVMLNQMYEILEWYDDLKSIIPSWYQQKNKV